MASRRPNLIVGIGASAGGVEAFEAFFRRMPEDMGMAFVLVTHLPRGHTSTLHEILARCTRMRVSVAADKAEILANHVYAAPADAIVTVVEDRLRLHTRSAELERRPIDVFLSSLAEARAESAVGVLLSGGGTDGTLGIKRIKEKGGLTLAQGTNGSAPKQPSMPDSAIAAGVVDIVLSTEEMPARLAQFARTFDPRQHAAAETGSVQEGAQSTVEAIYRILLNQVGHDFSGYKEKTFMRRVRRRMQVQQIEQLDSYLERLRADPDEVGMLFRDLLIGVTSFFRDPESFATLEREVIPRLFADKGTNDTVRVWVPGCATGEEVYSLAILMREYMQSLRVHPKVQLFATDIDETALGVARSGRYPASLLDKVSPQRLKQFFTGDDVSYVVNKDLRDLCIFSLHSVIRDPPFSRIDLISCRNLLIYFGVHFQSHVLPVFHYALRPRGYLLLGTSENVSQHTDLFSPVDRKTRLFQRRDTIAAPLQFRLFAPIDRSSRPAGESRNDIGTAANLRRAVDARVLDHYVTPHVVINREGDVLHYSARTGKYLEAAPGLPNRQLIAMARRGLRLDLRNAMRKAMEARRPVTRHGIAVEIDDRVQRIDLTVEPLGDNDADPLFLVLFADVGAPFTVSGEAGLQASGDKTTERLDQELRELRERLQATVEEYETAVEELKSSNEELQSMNEEFQSTNEELETSKEELQSVNEELQTVNAELNGKIDEVDRAHNDLRNVFESTQIPTIFLDNHLVIRSYTPAVSVVFNLIASDRGRPLSDIVSHLSDSEALHRDLRTVLEHGQPIERNVTRSDKSASFLMRVVPYRGQNNIVDGVLVTFTDVTRLAAAEAHHRTLVEELNHRVRNMLTVVSAIATQTLARQPDPASFVDAFLGRINALGKSYALVSLKKWQPVGLQEILDAELSAHLGDEDGRVKVDGPEVKFHPSQAFALGLVFHELTTNAMKYGALSGETGRLSVRWRLEDGKVLFDWLETGGNGNGPPQRRGFGTDLIERQMNSVFRAKPDISYPPDGMKLHVAIPLDAIRTAEPPQS
jgi:two-component system CheB/CheR fusion protein